MRCAEKGVDGAMDYDQMIFESRCPRVEFDCHNYKPKSSFVELKQGEWIKAECSEKNGDSKCSLCGHFDWSDCNFCSQCGADMRKVVM